MKTLHITNGDGAAGLIKNSTITGDVLPWRDPMHHGPFPNGLELEELSRIRAEYLAGPNMDIADVERDFRLRDQHLQAALDYDQVVLWFEHDLLDQLQILQILDWFAESDLVSTTLEIICIDNFPSIDNFRGIGQLDAVQVASLYPKRQNITPATLALAKTGWAKFRSDNVSHLLEFIQKDLSVLPYLKAALERYCEEFPDIHTGLSRTEKQLLSLVRDKSCNPVELFIQNMDIETALYMGDWSTYSSIAALCNASLLSCEPEPFWHPPYTKDQKRAFQEQRLSLTDVGMRILTGELNAFGLLERDMWLGSVHLRSDKPMWTWDANASQFVVRNT